MAELRILAWLFFLAICFWPRPAEAYLDPGSGSMLLQVVLGGIAAAGVVLRIFWARIRSVFRRSEDEGRPHAP